MIMEFTVWGENRVIKAMWRDDRLLSWEVAYEVNMAEAGIFDSQSK